MSQSTGAEGSRSTVAVKRGRMPGTYQIGLPFGGRTISTMGNRPQDHMDRDLLLASLLRDHRLRMFRKQCLKLPAWASAIPESVPTNYHRRAQQLIILGSMQQCLIEKMRDTIHVAADRNEGDRMLNAMEACLPRGALFTRTMADPGRACGRGRLCPWCHARSVQRLYRQLIEGPCTSDKLAEKHLVVLRTRVEDGEELDAQQVHSVRDDYRFRLRQVAREIGMQGGVIIHQVTPWIPQYDRRQDRHRVFAHVFTMIGVVDSQEIGNFSQTIDNACSDGWIGEHETKTLPAATRHALRYLLFGSSYKFDSSELGIVANDPRKLIYGIQGAAALEPWFLFTPRQAWSYATAMHGTRLFDTFGNWRPSQAERKRCSRKRCAKSEYGKENREMAFGFANDRRYSDANARRHKLVAIALPYFQKFKDAGGKRLGSPALRTVLNDAGHAVSDRDARWLAKNLPAMDTRTGLEKFTARRILATARTPRESRTAASLQSAE